MKTVFTAFFCIFLSLTSSQTDVRITKIDSLASVNSLAEAMAAWNQLPGKIQKKPEAQISKAHILFLSSEYKNAISIYKIQVKKNPQCATCITELADAYTALNRGDSAQFYLDQSFSLEKNNARPYFIRAQLNMNKAADSLYVLADITKGLSINKNAVRGHELLLNYYFGKQNFEKAKSAAYAILKLDQNNYFALFTQYLTLKAMQDLSGSMKYAELAFKAKPESPELNCLKIALTMNVNDSVLLNKNLDSICKRNPSSPLVYLYHANYYFNIGLIDNYCSELFTAWGKLKTQYDTVCYKILANAPALYCSKSNPEYFLERVRLQSTNTENFSKAIAILDEGERLIPNGCQIPFMSAYFYFRLGNYELAFLKLQKSIGNYSAQETYRVQQLYKLPYQQAISAEKNFRFRQYFMMQQCLFALRQKNGANSGYDLLTEKCSDSALVLLDFAGDKQSIEEFILLSSTAAYFQSNGAGLERIEGKLKQLNISSPLISYFKCLLILKKSYPDTFEEINPDYSGGQKAFPILKFKQQVKTEKTKNDSQLLVLINQAIAASPGTAYFYYVKSFLLYKSGNKEYCNDLNEAYKKGTDPKKFPDFSNKCKLP